MENFWRKTKNALVNPAGITSNAIDWASGRGDRRAANRSAEQLRLATEQARTQENQGYQDAYDLQKSYMDTGNEALRNLYEGLNAGKYDYQAPSAGEINSLTQQMIANDPGVEWRLKQGQRALDASAAARGNLMSSGQAKALQDFGQNQASQEYQQAYNRANNVVQDKYQAMRDNLNNHFSRLQQFANLGPQTAVNLANNRLGQAGANAGFIQDMGNINATRTMAINQANNNAFDRVLNVGTAVAGYAMGAPGVGMTSANPYTEFGAASTPSTVPADYKVMGDNLAGMWRKGYPSGY